MMAEAEIIAYASSVMMAEELEHVFGRWY